MPLRMPLEPRSARIDPRLGVTSRAEGPGTGAGVVTAYLSSITSRLSGRCRWRVPRRSRGRDDLRECESASDHHERLGDGLVIGSRDHDDLRHILRLHRKDDESRSTAALDVKLDPEQIFDRHIECEIVLRRDREPLVRQDDDAVACAYPDTDFLVRLEGPQGGMIFNRATLLDRDDPRRHDKLTVGRRRVSPRWEAQAAQNGLERGAAYWDAGWA